MIGGRIGLAADSDRVGRPFHGELRQDLADPAIAAGVAEQDQVAVANILRRDFGIVLDRQIAAVVPPPFVGYAVQAGLGPSTDLGVQRLAGSADAEEPRRKGVVDRPLHTGTLALQRDFSSVAKATP